VTVNSPIPMKHFKDGPRTHRTGRNTLDAAIDHRPYRLDLTVSGSGAGELLFRSDLQYKHGYVIRFDGENAILYKLVGRVRTELVSAPAPLGAYSLVVAGSKFTLSKPDGTWVWHTTDTSVPAGLRMRYAIGSQSWTTVGRLL
jgi:hypothetical protein